MEKNTNNIVVNQFQKGIVSDLHKSNMPDDAYTYSENIRLTGENAQNIALENVSGNKAIAYPKKCIVRYQSENKTTEIQDKVFENYYAISVTTLKDMAIILVTDGVSKGDILLCHIDLVKNIDANPNHFAFYSVVSDSYTLDINGNVTYYNPKIYADLFYEKDYYDTYAELRADGNIYYYIAGKRDKKSRAIVLEPKCKDCFDANNPFVFSYMLSKKYTPESFDALTTIIPYNKEPIIHLAGYDTTATDTFHLAGIKNSGKLLSGGYKYSVRYIDAFGNKTNWSPISAEIPVYNLPVPHDRKFNWNKCYGDKPEKFCNKSVRLRIENIDTTFEQIEIATVHNNDGIENAYSVVKLFINKSSDVIEYEHTGNELLIPVSIEELTVKKVTIFNFETLKSVSNILFIAKIKESIIDNVIGLQLIADRIKLSWRILPIKEDEGCFYPDNVNSPYASHVGLQSAKIGNYKIPAHCYYHVGYFRDEDYSYAIQFKLKDGTITPAFPIGKADYGKIVPNINYNYDTTNGSDCGGRLGEKFLQDYIGTDLLLKNDISESDYDTVNKYDDLCNPLSGYAYYRDGAYIYRSPAHSRDDCKIIRNKPYSPDPISGTPDYPFGSPFSHVSIYENYIASTKMGRAKEIQVLYPEFDIELTQDEESKIEGFWILRNDRKKYGRIKQTGISLVSTMDFFASQSYNPLATPVFMSYATFWYDSLDRCNYYEPFGQYNTKWFPVIGFYSYDELLAKDAYTVSEQDFLEFVYVNLPLATYVPGNVDCGLKDISTANGGTPFFYTPSLNPNHFEINGLSVSGCGGGGVAGDVTGIRSKEWYRALYLSLYSPTRIPPCQSYGLGQYEALYTSVLYAEINDWECIQSRQLGTTAFNITQALNQTGKDTTYDMLITDNNFTLGYYGTSADISLTFDFVNKTYVRKSTGDCNDVATYFFYVLPAKLLSIHDSLGFSYGIQLPNGAGTIGNPTWNNTNPLAAMGLTYYSQIRQPKSTYPAPIYREYYYASLFFSLDKARDVNATNNMQYPTAYDIRTQTLSSTQKKYFVSVFGGDCFIGKQFLQLQKRKGTPKGDILANNEQGTEEEVRYRSLHNSCYAETFNNISLKHLYTDEQDAILNFGSFPYFLNIRNADRENADLFEETGYNYGYTPKKDNFVQFAKPLNEESNTTKYQIRYSLKHLDVLKEDQYRIFLPNNYKDAIRRYGEIMKLEQLGENLIIGQTDGIGMYMVNQQAQIPTNAGEIKLGTTSVISDKAEYFSSENEIGVQDIFGIRNINNKVYLFDKKRKQIYTLTQQGLSNKSVEKGINSLLSDLEFSDNRNDLPVFIGQDRCYDEILFKIVHQGFYKPIDSVFTPHLVPQTLVFSEKIDAFSSFYTMQPDVLFSINNYFFGIERRKEGINIPSNEVHQLALFLHNHGERGTFFDIKKNSLFRHVVNAKQSATYNTIKIMSNSEFIPLSLRMLNHIFKDRVEVYPKRMRLSTSYQYAEKRLYNYINVRDIYFAHQNNIPVDNILFKEQLFHVDIPFTNEFDHYDTDKIDIAIEKNIKKEFETLSRLRDFWLEVEWEIDNAEGYLLDTIEYNTFNNKRVRWLYILTEIRNSVI